MSKTSNVKPYENKTAQNKGNPPLNALKRACDWSIKVLIKGNNANIPM